MPLSESMDLQGNAEHKERPRMRSGALCSNRAATQLKWGCWEYPEGWTSNAPVLGDILSLLKAGFVKVDLGGLKWVSDHLGE